MREARRERRPAHVRRALRTGALPGLLVCVAPAVAQAPDIAAGKATLENPVWAISLQVSGYEPWDDHPLKDRPNFVMAANTGGECPLHLSFFAETVKPETTASDCRHDYGKNPDTLSAQDGLTVLDHGTEPITFSLYDQRVSDQGPTQHQLFGYWIRGDICFELHVSSLACDSFREPALAILRSVEVGTDTGATLETVMLGRNMNRPAGDWEVHETAAGLYLHGSEPPDTERARRFYHSALQRGGAEIPPLDRWLIEEGIGLSWLMEDDGEQALPYLLRALEGVRESGEGSLDETLYNVACAHSLLGDESAACETARELFASLETRRKRKTMLKEMRADGQLERLLASECFDELLKAERLR